MFTLDPFSVIYQIADAMNFELASYIYRFQQDLACKSSGTDLEI